MVLLQAIREELSPVLVLNPEPLSAGGMNVPSAVMLQNVP